MAPYPPRPGFGLLRCPVCRLDLAASSGALACANRHSFDIAREGYVNLLRSAPRRPAEGGDSPEQLHHRAQFLEAGHFAAVAPAIVARLRQACAAAASGSWRVLDAGCGTGYHFAAVAASLGEAAPDIPVVGLGLDIARGAARLAARRWTGLSFAVADLWAEWPVRDAAVDLVLSMFAPKNFGETARVLRPGGWLAIVYPGTGHLAELGQRFGLMQHEGHKSSDYLAAAERHVGPSSVAHLTRRAILDRGAIRDAVLMGPNARHIDPTTLDGDPEPISVAFDFAILLARKTR
jgi:23S rRNA (guanine745-N1)-methyltransferase